MLDEKKILDIATSVATANLSSQNFTTVTASSTTDSLGNAALQITVVIKPGVTVTGEAALNTLVQIQDHLQAAGEERFPIIGYATEKELSASGPSES
jgi:hypothetical protein